MNDRDQLIRSIAGDKVFPSRKQIFIIEVATLHDVRHPDVKIIVLVK